MCDERHALAEYGVSVFQSSRDKHAIFPLFLVEKYERVAEIVHFQPIGRFKYKVSVLLPMNEVAAGRPQNFLLGKPLCPQMRIMTGIKNNVFVSRLDATARENI